MYYDFSSAFNLVPHTLLLMCTQALDLQVVMLASFVYTSLADILLEFLVPFWNKFRCSTRLCFRASTF